MKWIYLQALGMWLVFMVIGIVNGTIRTYGYGRFMSDLLAHQVSTFTGIALFAGAMYLFFRLTNAEYTRTDLIFLGLIWVGMTICFEFLFGHYVAGHSWSHLFHDYNILKGRLWLLVLIWIGIGPLVVGSIASGDLSLLSAAGTSSPSKGG